MTKLIDDYRVDAILCHQRSHQQRQALVLAQDAMRIALKTAGYENVDSMTQFERASALIDMAQELRALSEVRYYIGQHCEISELQEIAL